MKPTHIDVTMDFTDWGKGMHDLRIPIQLTVKQLLINLQDTLDMDITTPSRYAIKVTTKQLFLVDDDYLADYYVTDGDIFTVL